MEEKQQQIANRFAEVMRRRRLIYGWTYYELSKRTGVHHAHLCRIESGKNLPRIDTAIKICEALDLRLILTSNLEMV